MTTSPFLQNVGKLIGAISLISFVLIALYLTIKKITRLLHPQKNTFIQNTTQLTNDKVKQTENNRPLNLMWFAFFGFFIVPSLFYINVIPNDYKISTYIFTLIIFIFCLILIIPRRNNLLTLPLLIIISAITNLAFTRFYDFTWYFYPKFHPMLLAGGREEQWVAMSSWGVPFLTVVVCVYVLLSSISRLFFKKSRAFAFILIALFLTGVFSYILFLNFPLRLTFSDTEIRIQLDPTVKLELTAVPYNTNAKQVTSVPSATTYFMFASNLKKNKQYGIRLLTSEQKLQRETSVFFKCTNTNCEHNFGGANGFSDRLNPGIYTVQLIALEGKEMTVAAASIIEITTLVIKPFDKNTSYPCELWLTLGDSDKKLLRVDIADNQQMTDIKVYAQCPKDKTYNAQLTVGTISNDVLYYESVIMPTDEPTRIIGLGGNVTNGLVRLIIDNQVVGEAIINRGFPICDGEKILEGGNDSDCQKKINQ